MIKLFFLILSLVFASYTLLIGADSAFAEIVNFRSSLDNQACYPISLNETVSVKVNGQTGPSCDFSVDVVGGGEWVGTGDYFDSPPYAWGADTFYPDERRRGREYSFTCSQPAYSLDESKLPTYVTVAKEEIIPGSGTTQPAGKRYYLSVGDGAQTGTSFTASFSYETNCSMKDSDGVMETVAKGTSDCDGKSIININPRAKSTDFPISVGASCKPTTPTPTFTPTPTKIPDACNVTCTRDADCQADVYSSTNQCTACVGGSCKVPPACNSSCVRDSDCSGGPAVRDGCVACVNNQCQVPPSPTPTSTPTPTPTPFNAAACKCDGIEYTNLFSGQQTTITSFAKVEGSDTSKAIVKDQSFFFAEGGDTVAKIIGRSGPISSKVTSSTPQLARYESKWTFTLPQLTPGATYRIWSQVNCQPKLTALNYSPSGNAVLAETTSQEPKSFIDRILDFLNGLFGGKSSTPTTQPTPTPELGTGTGIILEDPEQATTQSSLQLGTVYPVEVYDKSCSFIKFRYDQGTQ